MVCVAAAAPAPQPEPTALVSAWLPLLAMVAIFTAVPDASGARIDRATVAVIWDYG